MFEEDELKDDKHEDPKDLSMADIDDAFDDDMGGDEFESIDAFASHEDDEDPSFTDRDGEY